MKENLRIAMLGHKHIPSRSGGIEVVAEELGARMAARGHEITCYNRAGRSGMYRGIRLKTVPSLQKRGLAAATSSFFASIFAALGPYDVVHVHAEGPCAWLWIPKLLGKRCVVTVHGLDWAREKWGKGFAAKYIRFGERMAVRWADAMIVLNISTQDYFLSAYGRQTQIIPNGVTRPQLRPARVITEKFGLAGGDYVLFVGRLVPEKGLGNLIRAFRAVDTEKKLVIAGGASDTEAFEKELHTLAAGDGRILFAGFQQGAVLEELFSNAWLYVLPSHLEGMPLSLLEAMSYGNCCLVSDIPGCAEVVQDSAVTFTRGNEEDLRQKLALLCRDGALVQHYRRLAAEQVCQHYNWDDITEQTLRLYREVQEKS